MQRTRRFDTSWDLSSYQLQAVLCAHRTRYRRTAVKKGFDMEYLALFIVLFVISVIVEIVKSHKPDWRNRHRRKRINKFVELRQRLRHADERFGNPWRSTKMHHVLCGLALSNARLGADRLGDHCAVMGRYTSVTTEEKDHFQTLLRYSQNLIDKAMWLLDNPNKDIPVSLFHEAHQPPPGFKTLEPTRRG